MHIIWYWIADNILILSLLLLSIITCKLPNNYLHTQAHKMLHKLGLARCFMMIMIVGNGNFTKTASLQLPNYHQTVHFTFYIVSLHTNTHATENPESTTKPRKTIQWAFVQKKLLAYFVVSTEMNIVMLKQCDSGLFKEILV